MASKNGSAGDENSSSGGEPVSLPQLCYDVAYFVLPHYAHKEPQKIIELCQKTPQVAGPFFYLMACLGRKVEPDIETGKRFCWTHDALAPGFDYFVLTYPTPPPLDLSDAIDSELLSAGGLVLAPYFSALIRNKENGQTSYFILGQAPIGGGTTLRSVTADGANCNLGPGPEPVLADFLAAIRGSRLFSQ
jgi:hypothetical protein